MKKTIALLLCFFMIITAFAGCKKEEIDKEDETTVPKEAQIVYSYDSVFNSKDESIKNLYSGICNAIINREESYRMNVDLLIDVEQLLYTSFPLIDLVEKLSPAEDNSGINIYYNYEKAEHDQKIKIFNDSVKSIIGECKLGEVSNTEYVFNIYNYIYNNAKLSEDVTIKLYDCIVKGEGTSTTYAKMFVFLANQANIEAYQVVGDDINLGTISFSLMNLNGSYYYFDPFNAKIKDLPCGIICFGMTADSLAGYGINNVKHVNYDDITIKAEDKRFADCQGATSYTLENQVLKLTLIDGSIVEINL